MGSNRTWSTQVVVEVRGLILPLESVSRGDEINSHEINCHQINFLLVNKTNIENSIKVKCSYTTGITVQSSYSIQIVTKIKFPILESHKKCTKSFILLNAPLLARRCSAPHLQLLKFDF